jgi:hypothetical protein
MKVIEASGVVLDWMVQRALGEPKEVKFHYQMVFDDTDDFKIKSRVGWLTRQNGDEFIKFSPTESEDLSNEIIHRENISIQEDDDGWVATLSNVSARGSTKAIAALHCFVISKLGEEVEVGEQFDQFARSLK